MYRVGDRVLVRPDLEETFGLGVVSGMVDFAGEYVTIKTADLSPVFDMGIYHIKEDRGIWAWSDHMFVGVIEEMDDVADMFLEVLSCGIK